MGIIFRLDCKMMWMMAMQRLLNILSSELEEALVDAAFLSGLIDPDLSRPLRQRNPYMH